MLERLFALRPLELEAHGFGQIMQRGISSKSAMLSCPVPSKARGISKRFLNRLVSFIREWDAEKLAVHGNISRKQRNASKRPMAKAARIHLWKLVLDAAEFAE